MQNPNPAATELQRAIDLLRSGKRIEARDRLREIVRADPQNAQAWLWLSGAAASEEERLESLREVLRIDPHNATALRGIAQLQPTASSADPAGLTPAPQIVAAAEPRPTLPVLAPLTVPLKARPSQVPVLLAFWLFFGGVLALVWLMRDLPGLMLPVAGALAGLMLLVTIYSAIRNSVTRYSFDGLALTAPLRGKRISLPIQQIHDVELHQSFFQRIIQTGNVNVYGTLHGELVRVQLRNIAGCRRFAEAIQAALQSTGQV